METIEIDPQLAQGLGFAEGDIVCVYTITSMLFVTVLQVEIGLLHDLPYATSVSTEPLTADDWEILVRDATLFVSTLSQLLCRNSTRLT